MNSDSNDLLRQHWLGLVPSHRRVSGAHRQKEAPELRRRAVRLRVLWKLLAGNWIAVRSDGKPSSARHAA
ncbi:hypothetical protein [Longispora albida]|uniref:hypothetical protein n=1 Tax=Longispora albida TaxID=203523 RepID=UPI00036E383D|nr:hypothetical protein [Longispora albida]